MVNNYFRIDKLRLLIFLVIILEVLMIFSGIKEAREVYQKKNQNSVVVK